MPLQFQHKLVLNQWMLRQFGVNKFEELQDQLRDERFEGLDSDNISHFCHRLVTFVGSSGSISRDDFIQFDENITRHTAAIQGRRKVPVKWKYFQYLTLLFTEVYLDRYFRDQDNLLDVLNFHVAAYNPGKGKADQVALFERPDLSKLAFWNATGSGKSLIMHVNIKQFEHYRDKHAKGRDYNRIILITPNEGLSRQHEEEFHLSGMQAEIFDKESMGLFRGKNIEILDINKLKEEGKEKTISVDAFEANNLVLIDEGHRGASGINWRDMRKRLAAEGFTFEYSATFGQSIKGKKDLEQEYAKAILFDYSYRYFYADGFGKDYRILNLAEDNDEDIRKLYLTACLMSFYQQLSVQQKKHKAYRAYNIEKPLCIFVGSKVSSVRNVAGRQVSDVLDVLLFLSEFVKDRTQSEAYIERLRGGKPGLLDAKNREIFDGAFPFIADYKISTPTVYEDIISRVFNAPVPAALHVEELKGSDGEVALRLGSNEPFGVINVGDAKKLCSLCKEHESEGFYVTDRQFSGSYFHALNENTSTINILIGSKKFTEGWNSWRVSTMGLMNIGRSEGSEIIQLFGRGVRLKGEGFSLKRHTAVMGKKRDEELHCLETLNVFGVRSDYMAQFEQFLRDEGVDDGSNREIIHIPVVQNTWPKSKLKTIKLKSGLNFKKQGERPTLALPDPDTINKIKVTLDWYPRLQTRSSGVSGGARVASQSEGYLTSDHVAMLDVERLYFTLQDYKAEKSRYNLNLDRAAIQTLLLDHSWYTLFIDPSELSIRNWNGANRWQEIAEALLKKFCNAYYNYKKAEWEAPHIEYRELDPNEDGNFIDEWKVSVDPDETHILSALVTIRDEIKRGNLDNFTVSSDKFLHFDQHLYSPLLFTGKGTTVDVKPVALNEGEKDFVEDLRSYVVSHRTSSLKDCEVYLLRNLTRGKGVGFFDAGNFYPDFILWLAKGDKQHICFIDPKGIRMLKGPGEDKIQFSRRIKDLETRLGDKDIRLHSFIISGTAYREVSWWGTGMSMADFADLNVLFQNDNKAGYIGEIIQKLT